MTALEHPGLGMGTWQAGQCKDWLKPMNSYSNYRSSKAISRARAAPLACRAAGTCFLKGIVAGGEYALWTLCKPLPVPASAHSCPVTFQGKWTTADTMGQAETSESHRKPLGNALCLGLGREQGSIFRLASGPGASRDNRHSYGLSFGVRFDPRCFCQDTITFNQSALMGTD